MTKEALYAIGTLLTWCGGAFALRALTLVIQWVLEKRADTSKLVLALVGGGVLLFVGTALTPKSGSAPFQLPLTWVIMPLAGYIAAGLAVVAVIRFLQSAGALSAFERSDKLRSAVTFLVLAVALGAWTGNDKTTKIEILKGGIPLDLATAVGLLLLAVGAVLAMVLSERASRTRGIAKGVSTHLALVVGSMVFGLPFAFLVVTSFKEDRDMSSPSGIIWVPRVTEQVPYFDPKLETYEGVFQGETVQAGLIEKTPDGKLKLDVVRPAVMRGLTFTVSPSEVKLVPRLIDVVTAEYKGVAIRGRAVEDLDDGRRRVVIDEPATLKGQEFVGTAAQVEKVRNVGLRVQNYTDALEYLPPETDKGLVYLKNTLLLVILSVIGTLTSSSLVAYGFSRLRFPGRDLLFSILLSTMMLPAAVTLLPQFLIFRSLGWIDTLLPLWVPSFFASAFNVFLLRQFFMGIPMELEDAAKIDGCSYLKAFSAVMLPQIKPALAVIAIWTFMSAWNNFMGPLIYINSPENMTISYALQLFQGDRVGEPGMLTAFATMSMIPVLALFVFAQKYFIEGVTLSGMGGR